MEDLLWFAGIVIVFGTLSMCDRADKKLRLDCAAQHTVAECKEILK